MRMNISLPTFASLPGEHRIFGNMFTLTILYCLYLFIVDSPGYQGTRVLTRNDMGTEWRSERDDPTHMEME